MIHKNERNGTGGVSVVMYEFCKFPLTKTFSYTMQTKPRKMEGFLKHSQSCLKKKKFENR